MKKTWVLILFLALPALTVLAEETRLGLAAGLELPARPSCEELIGGYRAGTNVMPGFYWETIPGQLGCGLTCLFRFDREPSALPELAYRWSTEWIASWDFRFHLFRWSFLDPFLELGFGGAGRVDTTDYQSAGLSREQLADPMLLSLFGQAGWGLGVRMGSLRVGARMLYRFFNDPPPNTAFRPYPLEPFHFDLMAGIRL
jgi:hypothetical protein